MRVLAITPRVDPDDDLLGFVHTWMSRLAERIEHLYVLQLWSAPSSLPANTTVSSMGKSGGAGRALQLARFARVVGSLCFGQRVDAVLAHMGPIFAVCAAPFTRASGLPLVLWYAHGAVSPTLRLAHALVDRVGTSTPAGFRIPSTKVSYTGQGIETDRFVPPECEPMEAPIVTIGRLSPAKDYETLLGAVAQLRRRGLSPKLEIVGGTRLSTDLEYLARLRSLRSRLGLESEVSFEGGISHRLVASRYQRAAAFASASRTGSLDKAILEALSCARLAVTSNEAFRDFFGPERRRYTFPAGDDATLANRLEEVLLLAASERRDRGMTLRERVIAEHGVDRLADELVALLGPTSQRLAREAPSEASGLRPGSKTAPGQGA